MDEEDDCDYDDECQDCGDDLPVGVNGAVWCYNCLLTRYEELKAEATRKDASPDTVILGGVEYVRVVPARRSRGESSTADTGRCTDLESGV